MAFIGYPILYVMANYGAAIAAAAAVGSAVVGGVNAQRSAKAASQADAYNALVAKQKAQSSLEGANQREEAMRRHARLVSGERRAAIAQSGAGLGGSNADIDRQSEIMAELDSLNIRYEGATQKTGLLNQSNLDATSSVNNLNRGKAERNMGYLSAATKAMTANWG